MGRLSSDDKPRPWEWCSGWALVLLVLMFSLVVEFRSAYLSRRMGDLGCFLRGAWAVASGHDPYDVTCDNGWHYNYPPLPAVLLMPLADPPRGFSTVGMVPYPVSVAIFYGLSVFWLGLAVHWTAEALEQAVPGLCSIPWGRRWLYLRVFPVWTCVLPIGHSLSRGQVTMLWMLIMAGLIGGVIRGRRLTAGLYLAAAVCLKIIPIYLLVYPLWRRDGRFLAGTLLGLVVGLGVIPAAAMGPRPAYNAYCHLARVLIGPALGLGEDQSRTTELIGIGATNNVSFQAVIYSSLYGVTENPATIFTPWIRRAHWLLGAVLTAATLAAAGRRRPADPLVDALLLNSLTLLNLLMSPVCHTLYFALLEAPVATLLILEWRRNDGLGLQTACAGMALSPRLALLALVIVISNAIPILPALDAFRNLGLAMYAVLLVWSISCVAMLRLRRPAKGCPEPLLSQSAA